MASAALPKILEMLRANPLQGDLAQMRANMERGSAATPLPADVKFEAVRAGGVPAEWAIAPGARAERVLVYVHGGGYTMGSLATHRALCGRLSRLAGLRVLNVAYRLAPEHPHPAAVEDGVAAVRWVYAQGVAPARVAIAGDSAGGGLTLATLLALRDAGDALPAAAVCISPWTDLAATGESIRTKASVDPMVTEAPLREMARAYLGGKDSRTPLASPLYADLRGLPPLLLQVGDAELLLDDATRLASRARDAGVDVTLEVWEEMFHVWHAFAEILPEAQRACERIAAWLEPRLALRTDADALGVIEQIHQLKARYFRLMDTKRWDEMRAVFAREATLTDEESNSRWSGRDGIVAGLAGVLAPPVRTFHHGHMPEIEVLSDTEARGVWAMNDWVDTPAFTLDGWGHYHERYVFEDGAWRIAELRLTRLRVLRAPKVAAKAKRAVKKAPARKSAAKRPNKKGKKR
ncbi:MAG: alpha/beta hydrolase fold domain-containing protein [Deltaproteobacteria bacterium]|nr:alpha/beta hydrolase fold domain-containing protein [Deltaproteobacteria bacterium]